ncbi:MAG: RecQ family ATP-dependent DNA helicase, partial [Anaerolineae bacterium]
MSDAGSAVDDLGLTTAQVRNLKGRYRSRLLNFLLRWEEFDDLHECLDVLVPLNPTLVSLADLRARALLAEGRADEALSVMEERLQRRQSLPARALLARIHLARGRLVSATEITRGMIKEREGSVLAWALLGRIELGRGDTGAARAAYLRTRDLRPQARAYLRGMLAVYRAEGDLVTASGYAVRLVDTAREDHPLAVGDYRRLRDYFRESGETTRVTEMEAALERRRAEELAELRELLAQAGVPPVALESGARVARPQERPGIASAQPADPMPSSDGIPVSDEERRTITGAVRQYFGFDSLLPGQLETIACVLRGEDVLTILPTGGGKSLCYQLPAMMAEGAPDGPAARGTTLVISPLIALMKDQVDSLPPKVRARATTINSTLAGTELRRRMDSVADGAYRLVYAAPERLRQPPFLHALRRAGVERLVVDEAHCVSMWGHDFRPDYLIIGRTREALGDPPLLAMTATAPTRVRRDILQRLQRPQESTDHPRIVAGDVTRANLQLEVLRAAGNDEKLRYLLAFCQSEPGSGIVYADTRARCERLAALLCRHGVNAGHYHAGIGDRHRVQDDFMSGRTRVVVATIAFGLGIDKPDIRFILHFFPPASLEAYYQEAGRAGRDGLPARCVLMISPLDKAVLTRRRRTNRLKAGFLRNVYAAVKGRLNAESEGRIALADLERDLKAEETRIRVALSLLEEAGLLRRGADLPRAANVQMSAACRKAALPEETAAFCRAARLRPQQWLTLDLAEVAAQAGIALGEIEQKVLAWQDAGWLRYRPSGRDAVVKLLPSPDDASDRVESLLERYEAVQAQRADEIAAYAAATRCRHGHLNAYLGGRTIARCKACDNCVTLPPLPVPDLP